MGYYAPLLTKRQSEVKHCFSEDKSSRPPARDRPGLAKAAQDRSASRGSFRATESGIRSAGTCW